MNTLNRVVDYMLSYSLSNLAFEDFDSYVNGKIRLYTDLFKGDKNSFIPEQIPFSYIYIPKDKDINAVLEKLKNKVNEYIWG